LNVTVSEADQHELARIAPQSRFAVVPNGVDTGFFQPGAGRENEVVFVGGSNWFPNRDARDHFAADILPWLRALDCSAPIRWVGHASPADRMQLRERYGIEMTGYVDDVRPYLRDAACFIVPLRVGGGTRLKILDAWAMGKAVVSTSVGCEGLAAVDGENILIRDTAQGFAEAVRVVCADQLLRQRLGANARSTVQQMYSWERIGEPMLDAYLSLAREHRAATEHR
jgi:glycosyltransferase involved in cell wall biosynthesis